MVDPDLEERLERLRSEFVRRFTEPDAEVRAVVSPYRICPLGAHVDHQGGPVLGTAIDAGTLIVFAPSKDRTCRLESTNFDAPCIVELDGDRAPSDWGRYFWAAAATLSRECGPLRRGIDALIEGTLPGGGLSSSASVVLGYLQALAEVNGEELEPTQQIVLARRAENEFVGVKCGILDPACIIASRRDHLVAIDTEHCTWEMVHGVKAADEGRFLVAFSGVGRNLQQTGFNDRVDQCHEAARRLGDLCGSPAEKLGQIEESAFLANESALPRSLARRARHFFEESARVRAGEDAWRRGDLEEFGRLMNDSCRSSIENFEVGSPEITALQALVAATPGVWGARFSGAGFGGCVVALVESGRAEESRREIESGYHRIAPGQTGARVFVAQSRDGLHLR